MQRLAIIGNFLAGARSGILQHLITLTARACQCLRVERTVGALVICAMVDIAESCGGFLNISTLKQGLRQVCAV